MDIKEYINILWRRKWVIIVTVLVTTIAAGLYTRAQIPMYRSSATLRIAASSSGGLSYSDYVYSTQLVNTYVEIATSRPILSELRTKLNIKNLPSITAETIPNTELVQIIVESAKPELAANAANSLAEILMSESRELYSGGGKSSLQILEEQLLESEAELEQAREAYIKFVLQSPEETGEIETMRQLLQSNQSTYTALLGQYTQATIRDEIRSSMITVIEPALVPQIPFQPRALLNYALGLAIGLMGGLTLAFLLESQDTSIHRSEDIETIVELSETAKIPKASKKNLGTYQNDFSELESAFQNLAFTLQSVKSQPAEKSFLIMSAEPNQGKSTITHRLALTLAEQGKKVVAIDCDTRIPKLHSLFELPNDSGLTDVLEKKVDLKDALQSTSAENAKLLTSGAATTHLIKLLRSEEMQKLLDDLKREFDYVLLDTSALLAASDIAAIAPNVDNVLLIARRGHAHPEALNSIKKVLAGSRFRDKPVRLIINQAESKKGYGRY